MSDKKALHLDFAGLWTSPNAFSKTPEGAFEVADNVVLRDAGVVEPRRGYQDTSALPSGQPINRVFTWGGVIFAIDVNGRIYAYNRTAGTWSSAYNLIATGPSNTPVRAASASKSFFVTTSSGVRVLDGTGRSFLPAGLLPPSVISAAMSNTNSAGTFLTAGSSVAYRAVLCRYDANNKLIQSAPSPRLVVTAPASQTYAPGAISKRDRGAFIFPLDQAEACVSATPNGLGVQQVTVTYAGAETYFAAGTLTVISLTPPNNFTLSWDGVANTSGSTQFNTTTATITTLPVNVTISGVLPYDEGFSGQWSFVQLYRTFSVGAGLTPSDEYFLVGEYKLTSADISAGSFTFQPDSTTDSFLTIPLYTNQNTGDGNGDNDRPPLAKEVCLFGGKMLYGNTVEPQSLDLQLIGTDSLYDGSIYRSLSVAGVTFTAGPSENAAARTFVRYTFGTVGQNIENTARSFCKVVSAYFSNSANSTPAGVRVAAYYVSGETDTPGRIFIQEQGVGGPAFTVQPNQSGQTCWVPDLSQASYSAASDNNARPSRLWWSPDGLPWSTPADNWVDVGAEDQDLLRIVAVRGTAFVFKTDGLWVAQVNSDGGVDVTPFDPSLVLLSPESCAVVGNSVYCLTNRGIVSVSESGVSTPVSVPISRDVSTVQSQAPQFATDAFGVGYENDGLYLLALPLTSGDDHCSQQYVFNTGFPSWTRWVLSNTRHGTFDPVSQSLVWAVGSKLWLERKAYASSDIMDPGNVAYPCSIKLLPFTAGDPLHDKRLAGTFWVFRVAEFSSATVGFDSDRANTTISVPLTVPNTYSWGGFPFGSTPYSATTRNFIIRANPPQGMLEAALFGLSMNIQQAAAFWQLEGLSVLFEPTTPIVRR